MTIALTLAFCLLSADPRPITASEAQQLALVAAGPHNRGLSLVPYANPTLSAFYAFQGLRDAPAAASPNVGFFAVDRKTGDVWNAVFCSEYKSAALKREQQKLRKRLGMSDAEYRQLRHPGPMCESTP